LPVYRILKSSAGHEWINFRIALQTSRPKADVWKLSGAFPVGHAGDPKVGCSDWLAVPTARRTTLQALDVPCRGDAGGRTVYVMRPRRLFLGNAVRTPAFGPPGPCRFTSRMTRFCEASGGAGGRPKNNSRIATQPSRLAIFGGGPARNANRSRIGPGRPPLSSNFCRTSLVNQEFVCKTDGQTFKDPAPYGPNSMFVLAGVVTPVQQFTSNLPRSGTLAALFRLPLHREPIIRAPTSVLLC